MNPDVAVNAMSDLGEGPSWDSKNQVLYWVDILGGLLHIYDPDKSKDSTVKVGEYLSSVVPRKSGGVVLTLQHGFYTLDLKGGKVSPIAEVEKEQGGNRFNDGKCDPAGRYWAGTMDMKEKSAVAALYRLETNGRVQKILSNVSISNGLGWSPDNKTMYYIDTPTKKVVAFDYDMESGNIANKRTAADFAGQPGDPDGMAVDAEGMIWVAHWGGYRITRWDPKTARPLDHVDVPAAHVTSCCFGGKNLDELYITSARTGVDPKALSEQPLAGDLFIVRPGVRGLATYAFDG